jgi:hypothetical protein
VEINKASYGEKDGEASKYGLCRREWLQNKASKIWNAYRDLPTYQSNSLPEDGNRERIHN